MDRYAVAVRCLLLSMRCMILVCKFGLAFFIGKYLDLASLGIFGLAAGAASFGPIVFGLGLIQVIMRDAVTLSLERVVERVLAYWCLVALLYGVILVAAVLTTVATGAPWLVVLVCGIVVFEHLGNDIVQLYSYREQPLWANGNAFIRGGLWIMVYVPVALLFPSFRSLSCVLGFWLAGSALAFVIFLLATRDWPWRTALSGELTPAWMKATIRRSLVIYVSDLSFAASQQIDRYVVTAFLGLRLAGVYFLYWSAANAVSNLVSVSVLQIERPRLIKAFHEGVAQHRRLVRSVMRVTVLSSLGFSLIVVCGVLLFLPLMKQQAVTQYPGALALIMAGIIVRNIADVGAMGLFTAHRDGITTVTNCAAVLGLLASQVILLPVAGLYGAGAAILIAFGAVSIQRHVLLFGGRAP